MAKIALKGFSKFSIFPVTKNDGTTYTTGEKVAIPWAQSLTRDEARSEYTIFADDTIYDTGSDYTGTTIDVVFAELPLSLKAQLEGAAYDETEKEYIHATTDIAPEFALTFAGLMLSGEYRMFKYYVAKVVSIKSDLQTKGDGTEIQTYTVSFRATQRIADNAIYTKKESEGKVTTWLDVVDNIPPVAQG